MQEQHCLKYNTHNVLCMSLGKVYCTAFNTEKYISFYFTVHANNHTVFPELKGNLYKKYLYIYFFSSYFSKTIHHYTY